MQVQDQFFPVTTVDGDMYLNPNRGFWSIVRPPNTEVVNYVLNPSFEAGVTTYWHNYLGDNNAVLSIVNKTPFDQDAAYDGGYALRVSQVFPGSRYGAQYAPAIWGETSGAYIPVPPKASMYVVVHVKATRGDIIELIASADQNSIPPGGLPSDFTLRTTQSTATGEWQRLRIRAVNQGFATTNLQVVVRVTPATFASGFFLLDAITVSSINASDYFDGETEGATWDGKPHLSRSRLNRFTRLIGDEVFLADIGFNVISYTGHGMMPVINDTIPYGQGGGAYYNRTWPDVRTITLVGQIENTRGIKSVQKTHSRLIELVGLHRFSVDPQPFILRYRLSQGNADTTGVLEIPVVYKGGLEGNVTNLYQEKITLVVEAYDELFWRTYHTKTIALVGDTPYTLCYHGTAPTSMLFRIEGKTEAAADVHISDLQNQTLNSVIYLRTSPSPAYESVAQANDLYVGHLDKICASVILRNKTTGATTDVTNHVKRPESVPSEFMLLHGNNTLVVTTNTPLGTTPAKIWMTYRERYLSATDAWRVKHMYDMQDTILNKVISPGFYAETRKVGDTQLTHDPLTFKEKC